MTDELAVVYGLEIMSACDGVPGACILYTKQGWKIIEDIQQANG